MRILPMLLFLTTCLMANSLLWAEDEAEPVAEEEVETETQAAESAAIQSTYLDLKPPFVANFGGHERLSYLKTEVALRVQIGGERAVMHHMPALRHHLLMLLSRQTEEGVTTMEGKEFLRQEALQEVRNVLSAEAGDHKVLDLLFNSFIVQSH